MGIQSRMRHPSQSQLLTYYFPQQDWSWLTDDLQRGSTSMMEPHPTAGSDCTCSGHRQCCQFHWSLRSRVIATATASAGVSHSRDVYAPYAGVLHSRDAMPLALEFHARATLCPSRWSYTCVTLCLSHWSSTLVQCLASERTMAMVCFRVMYSTSYEDSGHYPCPAFKRRGVSAMRPLCITADGRHVLLSSNVLP